MSLKNLMAVTLLWAVCGLAEPSVVTMNFYEAYEARQAETQLSYNKYEAAVEAYSTLAARTRDPDMATLAKARAAVAFGLQEGNYARGLERARAVADRPFSIQAQMQLMVGNGDAQNLLDAFGDEDIAAWPKRTLPNMERWGRQDLRALALVARARAYLETGNAQAAVADLERALEFADATSHKARILEFLARQVYERKLRDADKTFETDLRILELNEGFAGTLQARIQAANYLRGKQRYDEALKVLGPGWRKMRSGHWFPRGMKALAQTLADAGRYREAADAYRIMAEADDHRMSEADRTWAAAQMARMLAEAGSSEPSGKGMKDPIAWDAAPDNASDQEDTVNDLE